MTGPEGARFRVGFVGTGAMGNPMALNLISAGHRLTVHDLRRDGAQNLLEAGASWADSPGAVAAASEVTFLSLPSLAAIEDAVRGSGGVLAGAAPGSTVIDLSTSLPEVVRALAASAGTQDVHLLDAPVSGGVAGARKGALTIMVGGDRPVFERCRPLLEVLGDKIFHLGDAGAGTVAKLVNNMLFLSGLLATVESLVVAATAGVDLTVLREVVQAGSGGSFVWSHGTRAILNDRLAPSFTVALAAKDAELAVAMAEALDVDTPTGAHVRDELRRHRDGGLAAEDVFAIVKVLEARTGTTVRGRGLDGGAGAR